MRTVVISGGTGGLGSAVTEAFLQDGWRCVLPYNVAAEADRLRASAVVQAAGDRVALLEADLFDEDDVGRVMTAGTADAQAPLAALVNLVGGFDIYKPVHETPVARFEAQLRLNLRPTYLMCAAAIPHLLGRDDGAIVCVSSRAALRPFSGAAGYVTSKAAVLAFVDALAVEYTGEGIRTNAVLPSVIDTPANRRGQPDADHSRWVKPSEIAAVILFLCGPAAAAISGAHVPVYGRA